MLSAFKNVLLKPSAKYSVLVLLLAGLLIGFASTIGTIVILNATGSNDFCLSCHEMQTAYDEYTESVHYSNRHGIVVSCVDCHLPHEYPDKLFAKASRAMEIWYHIRGNIDTQEKYEAKRLEMAQIMWREFESNNSRQCRSCHKVENMAQNTQNDHAVKAHQRARRTNKTCVHCHLGTAHKVPQLPLPAAARPATADEPVLCTGCHKDISSVLSAHHPDVDQPTLKACLQCHIPGKTAPGKDNTFYTYLHKSHLFRIECTGCHKTTTEGSFKLLGYEN